MKGNPRDRTTAITTYCAGCNARFQRVARDGPCPRCGVDVISLSEADLNETLLCRDSPADFDPVKCELSTKRETADRLSGRQLHVYHCENLIGRGGMGCVYLARHDQLERKCALKILSPRLSNKDVDFISRFFQEGRSAAALVHPNIVTTHAIGEAEGFHFLEMEFVAGRSLQQLMDYEGRLTPTRATNLASLMAEGLSAAHRLEIIHRDLKPDNVLVTHQGIPKIADFGLAKRVVETKGTSARKLVGTPNFMAPELFELAPATPSSDVYALGVCYFLFLTGRYPYLCRSLSALHRAASTDPIPNVRDLCPDVPLEMAECLSLLLAKSPRSRPRDGIEAAQLLQAVSGQVRDIESLLREAFHDDPAVEWRRADNRYRLNVQLPDGRRQALFVEPSEHVATKRLLLFYSVCCPARPEYYEEALRLNSAISHGAIAVREIDGEKMFVMVDTYPRSTVDAEDVRRSALELAHRADAVEKLLTGLDRN